MYPILVAAAVLPVILLCYYIYAKDVNKEPIKLLAKMFFLGCISVVPILFVELFLENYFSTDGVNDFLIVFFYTFIGVAFVEELFKWIIVKFIGHNNKEFDELYDIIVYSVFVSLGFACIENIFYVIQNDLKIALLRALLSVPGHTCFAVIMGYFFSKAKINKMNDDYSKCALNMILSLLMPALIHTMYDALLFDGVSFSLFLIFDISMVVYCFVLVQKMSKIQSLVSYSVINGNLVSDVDGHVNFSLENKSPIRFCPICGKAAKDTDFCNSCGFKFK